MKRMLLDFSELCFKFITGNVNITSENTFGITELY